MSFALVRPSGGGARRGWRTPRRSSTAGAAPDRHGEEWVSRLLVGRDRERHERLLTKRSEA